MLTFSIYHDIIITETRKTQNKKREVKKMKNLRVYYRTANKENDLEVTEKTMEKVSSGFLYHESEYFYGMTETKSICDILENIESLKGRTFLTYSITDLFEID